MDIDMPLIFHKLARVIYYSNRFFCMCVNSLRFSMYKIMSPKLEMVYFFPISIPLIFRAKLPKPETPGKC